MGCDIHLVVEKRVANGKWVTVNTLTPFHTGHRNLGESDCAFPASSARNYKRFAALAGVRGDGPVPRGAPSDVSETVDYLIEYWGVDAHSHSWLSVSDAAQIFCDTECWLDGESFGKKYPAYFFFGVESEEIDSFRLVFWFDN